jgi:hypothetical protein
MNNQPIRAPNGWLHPPNKLAIKKLFIRDRVAKYSGNAMVNPSEMLCSAMATNKAKPNVGDAFEDIYVIKPS